MLQQSSDSSVVSIDRIGQEIKLVITFVYLLLGMAIVAMCHYLLKEEVGLKAKQFKRKMTNKLQAVKAYVDSNCCCCYKG